MLEVYIPLNKTFVNSLAFIAVFSTLLVWGVGGCNQQNLKQPNQPLKMAPDKTSNQTSSQAEFTQLLEGCDDAGIWSPDIDEDGYGDKDLRGIIYSCDSPGETFVENANDCDDMDASIQVCSDSH